MALKLPLPGIIGGAGPAATSQLYLDIMARCRRAGLDQRPAVLVASLRIDLSLEERLLSSGQGIEGYLESLVCSAKALEAAGVDFIAIPCNTLHLLLPDLVPRIAPPVLSIVDAVVAEVHQAGCRKVGLLGTAATVDTGLYQEGLRHGGVEVVCLDEQRQQALAQRIRDEVDQGPAKADDTLGADVAEFFRSRGAEVLVAACTELKSVMAGWPGDLPVVDSLDALGASVVREMLERWAPGAD